MGLETTLGAHEVLDEAAVRFEEELWSSDVGASIRGWLSRWNISDETLRSFNVGYAPGSTRWIFDSVGGGDENGLVEAGLASRSNRGRPHPRFHARVMFPVREPGGSLVGFAGLATHLGPSWPLWLTSPDHGPFDPSKAMFALDCATESIEQVERALVVRDCVEALALHQAGRTETVAVIQSPITRNHMSRLSQTIGAPGCEATRRDGHLGVVVAKPGASIDDGAFASRSTPNGLVLIHAHRKSRQPTKARSGPAESDSGKRTGSPTKALVLVGSGLLGAALPIGLLSLVGADENGDTASALNYTLIGLAGFYFLLAVVVARFSARTKAGSGARRMRLPWARGSGEVQPTGWTFHELEEVVVGAALVSAVVCIVFLSTIGGFFG